MCSIPSRWLHPVDGWSQFFTSLVACAKKGRVRPVMRQPWSELMNCCLCRKPAGNNPPPETGWIYRNNSRTNVVATPWWWRSGPSWCFDSIELLFTCCSWNIFQATPLCLSLEHSLHMWIHPCGSISHSTHSNTTGAWCPQPESDALMLFILALKCWNYGLIINFLAADQQSREFFTMYIVAIVLTTRGGQ